MALPPKKPAAGRPTTGKMAPKPAAPQTRRGGAGAAAPAAAPKNNLPILIGGAVAAVVLIVILVVVLGGGSEPKPEKAPKQEAKPEAARKAPPPDVSGLEATGKSKCEEGQRLIQPRLNPDPQAPKDRVFNDLENGLKLLNEGLDAYKKAAALAGKKYPLDEYQRTRDRAIKVFCTELESVGKKSCDQGAQLIQSCAGLMTGKAITDEEKSKLAGDLKKGKTLISEGMAMLSRASAVSGHTYETTQYQEAL
ncbi:MAG: hypothetical protein JO332_16025, partial [Planctomycetaceae bacterium]|nr:hypothetical protein [Planctomycetaceae bacterium]